MDKSSAIYLSPSSWESRPAEARRVTEPLRMHAWRSSALLFAARFAKRRRPASVEAAGLRLWRGEILDHPVQHGLQIGQAVHRLLHEQQGEQKASC